MLVGAARADQAPKPTASAVMNAILFNTIPLSSFLYELSGYRSGPVHSKLLRRAGGRFGPRVLLDCHRLDWHWKIRGNGGRRVSAGRRRTKAGLRLTEMPSGMQSFARNLTSQAANELCASSGSRSCASMARTSLRTARQWSYRSRRGAVIKTRIDYVSGPWPS